MSDDLMTEAWDLGDTISGLKYENGELFEIVVDDEERAALAWVEGEAEARLISAAPKMAAALLAVLHDDDAGAMHPEVLEKVGEAAVEAGLIDALRRRENSTRA